ncbi:MAG: sulfate adenylyltransferase subunit CysD [Planctomycetes bacterium]|nr:sulfate adenylyltransferase subunit CysD [Planctomycetota bacterium]
MTETPSPGTHLDVLEAESIHIFREVAAGFERPVLMYSVGKDSSVLLRLAQKAFHPGKLPFPLLHVDTGYKFPQMYAFRDETAASIGADLIVAGNQEAISAGTNPWELGTVRCCSLLKTQALIAALTEGDFDAAIGGARRDEERSRAKERIFSFRDQVGQWDPKNQRPELWNLYNTRVNPGEHIRVFPLSNWTEGDVWDYIHREEIPIVPLYYAQERDVIAGEGDTVFPIDSLPPSERAGAKTERVMCRYRTLGCAPCTGAFRSEAATVQDIVREMSEFKTSERVGRVIDHDADGSMEDKKREGYF